MEQVKITLFFIVSVFLLKSVTAQPLVKGSQFLFKSASTKMTNAEKNHLFGELFIRWSTKKKQFVDNDDTEEAAPYRQVSFFPVDLNKDGTEEIFVVFLNEALFETAGAQAVLFTKDSDGSYQRNTEIPSEDVVPLTRKHLGYPDLLLGAAADIFKIWRWDGKKYAFFQKLTGQQLPNGPDQGLEDVSKTYQASLRKTR